MNTKKTAITIVAAMMAIAMITTTVMAVVCERPCGTKVEQADVDAEYALAFTPMQLIYFDANSNNFFDAADTAYVDTLIDAAAPLAVEAGDVRLTEFCGTFEPNTKVTQHDADCGKPAKVSPGLVGFVDDNENGVYDLADPLYLDMQVPATYGAGVVSIGDIRLWPGAYTIVATGDDDLGAALFDMLAPPALPATAIGFFLGYIDSDCSLTWTCPDKLYLQQWTGLVQFDTAVTIGDFRIYIPPEAITDEGWPECGTKVEQGDMDAVYALIRPAGIAGEGVPNPDARLPVMWLTYFDANSNNIFDAEDTAYVDTLVDPAVPLSVESGDIRITPFCGTFLGNTKVTPHDGDCGKPTKVVGTIADPWLPLPCGCPGFVDINGNGVYDLGDPLYLDMDGDAVVTIGDVRLITDGIPYTIVNQTSSDRGLPLWDPLLTIPGVPAVPATPLIWFLGYIDSDCSMSWTCPDKMYLQQLDPVLNRDGNHDRYVTIGDMRFYIPPEAITDEGWPECGTKVEQCTKDAVYVLTVPAAMQLIYFDANSNNIFDAEDTAYVDTLIDGPLWTVESGDVRLTEFCGTFEPNTKVTPHDGDCGKPAKLVTTGGNILGLPGFVDVNGNGNYDLGDPLYLDMDRWNPAGVDVVSIGDIRLWPDGMPYDPYTIVAQDDTDLGLALFDPFLSAPGAPVTPLATPFPFYLGWIDSDCSQTWTCPDKLHFQQMRGGPHDFLITIGDMRLYMPPGGPGEEEYNPYDTNEDCTIDFDEVMGAIQDYFNTVIDFDGVMEIVILYFNSPYC